MPLSAVALMLLPAFVFAVAPHHPLATFDGPISDTELLKHRAVAVADTAQRLSPLTLNLLRLMSVYESVDRPDLKYPPFAPVDPPAPGTRFRVVAR